MSAFISRKSNKWHNLISFDFFFSHLKKYSDDYSKFKGRFFFLKLLSPLNISNVWLLFFVTINTIKSNHRNVIKHQIQHEMIDDKKYKCKFLCINDSRIWFLCSIPFFLDWWQTKVNSARVKLSLYWCCDSRRHGRVFHRPSTPACLSWWMAKERRTMNGRQTQQIKLLQHLLSSYLRFWTDTLGNLLAKLMV